MKMGVGVLDGTKPKGVFVGVGGRDVMLGNGVSVWDAIAVGICRVGVSEGLDAPLVRTGADEVWTGAETGAGSAN